MGAPQETYTEMTALFFTVALIFGVTKGVSKTAKPCYAPSIEVHSKSQGTKKGNKKKGK